MTDVIVVRETERLLVSSPGPQGPAGPQGAPGTGSGTYFRHDQVSPAATWIVNHNLGVYIGATIFDSLGRQVYADVVQGSPNQTTVTFPAPTVGSLTLP